MRHTDNIQKQSAYERLAQRAEQANERRRELSLLVRRVINMRRFEEVLSQISARSA